MAQVRQSPKFSSANDGRIGNDFNLPDTPRFCPMVRRTTTLEACLSTFTLTEARLP